jgi:hypothetical protein
LCALMASMFACAGHVPAMSHWCAAQLPDACIALRMQVCITYELISYGFHDIVFFQTCVICHLSYLGRPWHVHIPFKYILQCQQQEVLGQHYSASCEHGTSLTDVRCCCLPLAAVVHTSSL